MTEIGKQHDSYLKKTQDQIRFFYSQNQKVKIYHGSTNSTRAQNFEKDKFVDVSQLNHVVEINTKEQYVLVEPNVPMDKLVEATLEYNLVPPVVMEFPGITVGGGVQGGAGESSSFKYGLFHDICLEYEIVVGNGEVFTVSPTQNPDLFYGTACSYGSLGIITLVKLRLVPAKEFVCLTYHNVKSFDEALSLTKKKVAKKVDFVDGIMFSKKLGTVMVGNFSEKQNLPISTFCGASDEWFYLHASKISKHHEEYEELIPIRDYLFRYDRGAFWMGLFVFRFFKLPFIKIIRSLGDKLFKTRKIYQLLHATNLSQRFVVQDISLPENGALRFLEFVDRELHVYPLWICPLLPGKNSKLSPSCLETNLVINVGVWGEVQREFSQFVKINRDLENEVINLKGRKVLYAHAYYTQDEFWKIYDLAEYNSLREKYFATSVFPDIYTNTRVFEQYKPSVWRGLWKFLRFPKLPIS